MQRPDRARAQTGAAWRILCTGASRCLGRGCVKSAPFLFRNPPPRASCLTLKHPMKRRILIVFSALALVGCASDPLMTGEPHDWVGHLASDLKAAMGEPTRIIPPDQLPGQRPGHCQNVRGKSRRKRDLGIPPNRGGCFSKGKRYFLQHARRGQQLGIRSTRRNQHDRNPGATEPLREHWRYEIKNGKVVKWYAARLVDGKTVWSQH